MASSQRRRDQLKEFLRARREALTPGDVGLPDAGALTFEYSLFRLPDRADLNVVLHTPQPGTGTRERVESLVAVHPR
ncbi:hypothetical protein [Nonomuraea candida]|uniref:hypothetical protein n=1 Tax=Nonomuraea candida TaxID=359159 RepID=UPI001B80ADCC|nr:hypothetical protein [Nonomuraea candida]